MNIVTTQNGFEFDGIEYKFSEEQKTEIVSDFQLFAYTDSCIILLDNSCSIDDVFYDDIETFAIKLVNQ